MTNRMTKTELWEAREELKRKINEQEPEFLGRDKSGKGFICPVCGNGSGEDGTGMRRNKRTGTYHCFKCGGKNAANVFTLWQRFKGDNDFLHALEACAAEFRLDFPKNEAGRTYTAAELAEYEAKQRAKKEERERQAEIDRKAKAEYDAEIARLAQAEYAKALGSVSDCKPFNHPYTVRKLIADTLPACAAVGTYNHYEDSDPTTGKIKSTMRNALMFPTYKQEGGEITGLQYIGQNGEKRFFDGMDCDGIFTPICGENIANPTRIFIAEGIATGCSFAETINAKAPVICAYTSGNLEAVCNTFKANHPDAKIIIVADDDRENERKGKGNTGIKAAQKCAGAYIVKIPDSLAEQGKTDWNDFIVEGVKNRMKDYAPIGTTDADRARARALHVRDVKNEVAGMAAQEIEKQLKGQTPIPPKEQPTPQADAATNGKPAQGNTTTTPTHQRIKCWNLTRSPQIRDTPIEWVVDGIIPRVGIGAIVAPRASGKTWLILDLALSVACGLSEWHGKPIRNYAECRDVIYFCGEGSQNLKTRLNLWLEYNNASDNDGHFIVTDAPEHLTDDTRHKLYDEIHAENIHPCLIILDTLNCYFDGEENAARDMTAFTSSMRKLSQNYQCCVVVIHHTGHATETQNRERGSVALSSNVDIFSFLETCKYNNGLAYTLTQAKNKFAPEAENGISLKVEKVESAKYCRQDGSPETALIPVSVIQNTPRNIADEPQPTPKQKRWLGYIATACKTIDNPGNPFNPTRYDFAHVALSDVKAIAKDHILNEQSFDTTFNKALDDLEENGFIAYNKHAKDKQGKDTTLIEILHRATIIELNGKEAPQPTATQEGKEQSATIFDPLRGSQTKRNTAALKG